MHRWMSASTPLTYRNLFHAAGRTKGAPSRRRQARKEARRKAADQPGAKRGWMLGCHTGLRRNGRTSDGPRPPELPLHLNSLPGADHRAKAEAPRARVREPLPSRASRGVRGRRSLARVAHSHRERTKAGRELWVASGVSLREEMPCPPIQWICKGKSIADGFTGSRPTPRP